VLDTTIHKTKDEDKQNKKHNTIYVGRHHTQWKRRRQTNQKPQHNVMDTTMHNAICFEHHHAEDKRRRQTNKQKTQHNMRWTTPYTGQKTKTNKPKNKTQCVGHHHTEDQRRTQTKQ
jgi:hypothetical protein